MLVAVGFQFNERRGNFIHENKVRIETLVEVAVKVEIDKT